MKDNKRKRGRDKIGEREKKRRKKVPMWGLNPQPPMSYIPCSDIQYPPSDSDACPSSVLISPSVINQNLVLFNVLPCY